MAIDRYDFRKNRAMQTGIGYDILQNGMFTPDIMSNILSQYRRAAAMERQRVGSGLASQLGSRADSLPGLAASVNSRLLGNTNSAVPNMVFNMNMENQRTRPLGASIFDRGITGLSNLWQYEDSKPGLFDKFLGLGAGLGGLLTGNIGGLLGGKKPKNAISTSDFGRYTSFGGF